MLKVKKIFSLFLVMCLLVTSTYVTPLNVFSEAVAEDETSLSDGVVSEPVISETEATETQPMSAEEISTLRTEMNAELETSKIFDYIDESQFEAANHVSRLHDEEELNTYVFLNEDGSHTMYLLDENVKYVSEDGSVKEKDVSLVQKGNTSSGEVSVMSAGLISGNVGTISGDYTVKSNNIGLTLPNDISKGIELTHGTKKVTLTPLGISNLSANLKATANASLNTVAYDAAYGNGVSLKYTPTLSGIKEDIVLSSYTGINSFSFTLATNGMYVYTDVNGDYYIAETEDSVQRFSLGRIVVYDANKRQSLGSMTVETVKDGQLYLLTVSADESFLLDSKTVYPVTIDPSITVSETTAGTAIQDAPVFANYPTSNFGAYLYNNIGQEDTNYGNAMTAVKLSGLADNLTYKTLNASDITSVLFYAKEAPYFTAKYVKLYRLSAVPSWTESTVTWNNVGSYSNSGAVSGSLSTCSWSSFDITSFVKGWKTGNYANSMSILFALDTTQSTGYTQFNSSEYSTTADRPYVVVNYTFQNIFERGTYYIENKQLGNYLRPQNGSTTSGTTMELWSFAGNDAQKWMVVSVGSGYYKIKNVASGLFLSVAESDVSKENGAVVQEAYVGATRQQWRIYRTTYGGMAIKPKSAGTGVNVLSVSDGNNGDGAVVSQRGYAYNASYKDEWYICPTITSGDTYYVENKQLGSYMQPKNGLTTGGNATELWTSAQDTKQRWTFTSVGSGYYKITSALSGLALSVSSSSLTSDNGPILQESYTGADRQKWKIYKTISNGYIIKPKSAGTANFVLSVKEGNLGDGAVVVQRPEVFNTSYKEEWLLEKIGTSTGITLNKTTLELKVGNTLQLTATTTPSGQTVTWSTSNSTIATVSSTGFVTAVNAGTAIITVATSTGASANCLVRVSLVNGVYCLNSPTTSVQLTVAGKGFFEQVDNIYAANNYGDYFSLAAGTRQIWKIFYLGSGYYSIRPMTNPKLGLYANGSNPELRSIGTTDSLASIPDQAKWCIDFLSVGICISNMGDSNKALFFKNGSATAGTDAIVSKLPATSNAYFWSLAKIENVPTRIKIYDYTTGAFFVNTKSVELAEDSVDNVKTLYELGLFVAPLNVNSINPTITYSSSDATVATINNSGSITIVGVGSTRISAGISGCENASFELTVWSLPDGQYIIRSNNSAVNQWLGANNTTAGYPFSEIGITHYQAQYVDCVWNITRLTNGYYKIEYAKNGYVPFVLVEEGASENVQITQSGYMGLNTQMWMFIPTGDRTYKIKSKAAMEAEKDLVLAIDEGYTYQCEYGVNTDDWLLYEAKFSFVNYYDNSLDTSGNMISLIENANLVAKDVFEKATNYAIKENGIVVDTVNITFEQDGAVTEYEDAIASQCEVGVNQPCNINCTEQHKNVNLISEQLYEDDRENNHIYVMWNDRDASSYSMIGEDTNGLVINFRPVIHVMTMPEDESKLESYTAAVLIHETLHTLQIPDVTDHSEASDCVMYYGGYDYLDDLYDGYLDNDLSSLLCENCQDLINGFFTTTMFINGN